MGDGEREIDFWWKGIFLGGRMMSKFLAGGEKTPPPPFPSRENPDLHSSLRFNFKVTYVPCLSYEILSFVLLISNGTCTKTL